MSEVLNKVRDVDPSNSDAVKDALSSFFLNLPKHAVADCNRWLRALENIINRFPRFCGSHRNTIETYLANFIDSSNYYNVIEAAKCAHALQQVRPPQEKTATAKICWREHLTVLCNAAHKLVGAMFPKSVDIYKGNNDSLKTQLQSSATSPFCAALAQVLSVPKTQNSNITKQALLGIRLRNVFVFLQASLVEIFPVAKPVQPQLIIEVIVRALSVSSGVQQPQDISRAVGVKLQALRTLDALVACLGPNLIPYSALIFKFVILTLKWCTDNLNEETRDVRRGAYDSLRQWLRALHTCRLSDSERGRGWEDELVQHVVNDITPPRHVVQLTMRPQSSRHLSKKAKRKQANAMLQESSIASSSNTNVTMSEESNDDIAITALEFVETFLDVCGVFLKPTTHKLLQERIIRACYNLDAFAPRRGAALIRTLEALRKSTPAALAPPTQHCLQLYSALATHRDQEISIFCSQALLDIRLHLHCSPPSLNYAIEAPRPEKVVEQPKMSSRNRAALESLLGAERVPKGKPEIIDLEDEPAQKKPRIDHNEITVSSESSVEISDESDDEVQEVTVNEQAEKDNADVVDGEEDEEEGEEEDVVDARQASVNKDTRVNSNPANESQEATEDSNDEASNESESNYSKETESKTESQSAVTNDESSKDGRSKDDSQDASVNDETQESCTTAESYEESKSRESAPTSNAMNTETEESQEEQSEKAGDIHEVNTQMPPSDSGHSAEETRSPRSMDVEIAYDLQDKHGTKRPIIETEDDNLPSTNDTDDVPITCGQVLKSSQELDAEKSNKVENKENEEPKINGDNKLDKTGETGTDKTGGTKDVSVEDMLADFVDEVVEENKT